jgi:hypothetical protein
VVVSSGSRIQEPPSDPPRPDAIEVAITSGELPTLLATEDE